MTLLDRLNAAVANATALGLERLPSIALMHEAANKIAAQSADIETLTNMAANSIRRGRTLHMVADQFEFYARQHHDKAEDAFNANDVGLAAIAHGKAKVNERMAALCRSALGDEVEMTAGDLGMVDD